MAVAPISFQKGLSGWVNRWGEESKRADSVGGVGVGGVGSGVGQVEG